MAIKNAASRSIASREVVAQTTTDATGNYTLTKVPVGNYTIYASSQNSLEQAVYIGVTVAAKDTVTVSDLDLTATGSISGTATFGGALTGNLGIIVYVAGTSYCAITQDNGAYIISGVPVGTGYTLVASAPGYANSTPQTVSVSTGTTTTATAISLQSTAHTVTYDGNGATGAPPVDSNNYQQNTAVTVTSSTGTLVNTGNTLAGWMTKTDGTGTSYAPGVTFPGSNNVTLYAVWIPNSFVFTSSGSNITLLQYPTSATGTVVIPAGVTALGFLSSPPNGGWGNNSGEGTFNSCAITSITIPPSVTTIGAAHSTSVLV